jgi:anti-anti-sigma factor
MQAPPLLTVEVRLDGTAALVTLVGEFDLTGVEAFQRKIEQVRADCSADQLTLDCSRLAFIDAAGVRMLEAVARAAGERPPTLRGVSPLLRRILELTQTDDLFHIAEG